MRLPAVLDRKVYSVGVVLVELCRWGLLSDPMGFEIASGTRGGKSTHEGEFCTMSRLVGPNFGWVKTRPA